MNVTDDQRVCNSKTLPEAVENILESDRKLTIGKIFPGSEYIITMTFLGIRKTMESFLV